MHSTSTSSADWRKLIDLIRDVKIAMLTTRASDGTMHSRPLTTLDSDDFDGALWFLIAADSEKAQEIARRPQVNLGYANPDDGKYVSVSGVAELVRDRARVRELWTPIAKVFFPRGPDDPNLVVLKVDVRSAEYWASPSSRVERLMGMAKAMLKGDESALGENKTIDAAH
jgi:general stress protein 26